jgi:hypothetical protein
MNTIQGDILEEKTTEKARFSSIQLRTYTKHPGMLFGHPKVLADLLTMLLKRRRCSTLSAGVEDFQLYPTFAATRKLHAV